MVMRSSYAGNPKNNTVMYIGNKVSYLINNLFSVHGCLCFVGNKVEVPYEVMKNNEIVCCDNPQLEYAKFVEKIISLQKREDYKVTDSWYYVGANVHIGENAYIEPGVVIGSGVSIGDNAQLLAGCVIKNAIIGDDFYCAENVTVGTDGFTMTKDENGNIIKIYSLGNIEIGDGVVIGPGSDISRGSCGTTVIEDHVKIGSLVHIGHEDRIGKNTEIVDGTILGGFVDVGEECYFGMNSCVKNRISIKTGSNIGMASMVAKSIDANSIVRATPSRIMKSGWQEELKKGE